MRRFFRFKWGFSLQEEAQTLDQLSERIARRSSMVPHDRLRITVSEGGGFRVHATGINEEIARRKDVERFIQQHYRKVRERILSQCHY